MMLIGTRIDYSCEACDFHGVIGEVYLHLVSAHPPEGQGTYARCTLCGITFLWIDLPTHIADAHVQYP